MLLIVLSILLILMSLLLLVASPVGGVAGLVVGIALLYTGLKRRKANKEQPPVPNPVVSASKIVTPVTQKPKTNKSFRFKCPVVGLRYREENVINLLYENDDYNDPDGDGRVYKYDFYDGSALLEPEPTNKYDSNAIKVIVDGEHIGYIPSEKCNKVKELIKEPYTASVSVSGGPYKELNPDNDKWERVKSPFYADLTIE